MRSPGNPTRAANARILIALVDVAAGVVAISYPNITAVVLVVIVAIWAIAFGVLELFAAFGAGETWEPGRVRRRRPGVARFGSSWWSA